jgi:hypothetical protein
MFSRLWPRSWLIADAVVSVLLSGPRAADVPHGAGGCAVPLPRDLAQLRLLRERHA